MAFGYRYDPIQGRMMMKPMGEEASADTPARRPLRTNELKAGMKVIPTHTLTADKHFHGEPATVETTNGGGTSRGLITINFRRLDGTLLVFPSDAMSTWLLVEGNAPAS